jgi:hypothetical protein
MLIEPNIAMHQARLLGLDVAQIALGGLVMASVSRSTKERWLTALA